MKPLRTTTLLSGLVAMLVILAGCRGPETDPSAGSPSSGAETALALFDLALLDDADPQRVELLFGVIDDERERATLLDAIEALGHASELEIVGTYSMDDLGRVSFDLVGRLAGGGTAHYSVQLDTESDPGLIVWFNGPGVEWPVRRLRGPGLSTSAPPEPAAGG